MLKQQNYFFLSLYFVMIILTGCKNTDNEHQTNHHESIIIEDFELFVGFDHHGLVRPVQVEVLSDGNVAVLDNQTNLVHIFNTEAKMITSFGGEGRGPGEFQQATQLLYSENYLYVVDANLRQINQFKYSGEFIQSFDVDTGMYLPYVTMMNDESFFTMTMGENGSLIKKINVNTGSTNYIGEAIGEEYRPGNFEEEVRTLRNGEVPGFMKNEITKHFNNNHLYVFLNTLSRLQKYTPDGRMLWDMEIHMPVNQAIFDDAVDRAHGPEGEWGVPAFKYILSMKVFENEPYILWNYIDGFQQALVHIDKDGQVTTIYKIQNGSSVLIDFSFDTYNDILYAIDSESGQVYRTRLPQ